MENNSRRTRGFFAAVAAVAVVSLAGCNNYDRLIELDQTCESTWGDVQAELQRRYDLVPNLVAAVKGSAAHEEKTLAEVTQARASATSIKLTGADLEDPVKMEAFNKAQAQLSGSLSRLMVVQEQYPDLKANQGFHSLQVQLEATENRILRSRQQYNASVRDFNSELGKIRGKVVKRASGNTFKPRQYFNATSADAQQAPKVSF